MDGRTDFPSRSAAFELHWNLCDVCFAELSTAIASGATEAHVLHPDAVHAADPIKPKVTEHSLPPLRCEVTKNLCGTDTWPAGRPGNDCRCLGCQRYRGRLEATLALSEGLDAALEAGVAESEASATTERAHRRILSDDRLRLVEHLKYVQSAGMEGALDKRLREGDYSLRVSAEEPRGAECVCAAIMRRDPKRHFKGCPLRDAPMEPMS